jgi:hypothetical protein
MKSLITRSLGLFIFIPCILLLTSCAAGDAQFTQDSRYQFDHSYFQ